jgi:D-amino-acid dehydrogenase
MHICVIGAGVIGLTTAYYLQSEGHKLTVVDREAAAGLGASAANGAQLSYGFVAPLADASVPPQLPNLLFARDSPLKLHPRLDFEQWEWGWQFLRHSNTTDALATTEAMLRLAELSREFIEPLIEGEGIECHFARGGKLVVYPNASSLAKARRQVAYQATHGSYQTVLTPEQCIEHEPALANYCKHITGGVWTPTDASADCGAFCEQLAALLARRGVEFQFGRSVERIDLHGEGVGAVVTGAGALRADVYVLAAGVGARAIAGSAGLKLPIYPLKGYSITVKPDGGTLPRVSITDARRKVVFAPLGDSVRVAGFVEIGDRDTAIPPARIGALLDATREVLGYGVIDGDLRPWAGLRPATPSGRPIIGRTKIRNLYLNAGHGALGWTLAGGSARLIADAIAGRTPTIDDRPFAYR